MTDTLKDMNTRHKFSDMKVEAYTTGGITSATDYRVELPTDFGQLIGDVKIIDGDYSKPLIKLSKPMFNEKYSYLSGSNTDLGYPAHYCMWNNQILIGPKPDKTTYGFEIDYTRKIVTAIVTGTAAVPFTDDYRETVRAGVLTKVFELMEEYNKAGYWNAKHDRGMQIIMRNDIDNESAQVNIKYHGV